MPDIDLTPMNEATARELFAHVTTENVLQKMDLTPEEEPVMRLRWQENMRLHWDDTPATDDKKLYFRELALAATLTTWKDVARQTLRGTAERYRAKAKALSELPNLDKTSFHMSIATLLDLADELDRDAELAPVNAPDEAAPHEG